MGQKLSLIADIGGTNARFALVESGSVSPIEAKTLPCADYPAIEQAITEYLASVSLPQSEKPDQAAIAIATAVTSDHLKMTNHTWDFSIKSVGNSLGFSQLKFLNDYTALALALPQLTDTQYVKIGGGALQPGKPMAVIGPGTGLGVSGIIPNGEFWLPIEGEGGHISYGPLNEDEHRVIELMRQRLEHVSAETLVSGPGLSLIYDMLTELNGQHRQLLKPSEVMHQALESNDPIAIKTLSMMFEILGSVAGNLALTLGARGGVFIGGGVIPRALDLFRQSGFRQRFEKHGRFTNYLSQISTHVIDTEYPALTGAAVSLSPGYKNIGVNSN